MYRAVKILSVSGSAIRAHISVNICRWRSYHSSSNRLYCASSSTRRIAKSSSVDVERELCTLVFGIKAVLLSAAARNTFNLSARFCNSSVSNQNACRSAFFIPIASLSIISYLHSFIINFSSINGALGGSCFCRFSRCFRIRVV